MRSARAETLRAVKPSEVKIAVRPLPHHRDKQEAEQEAEMKRRRKYEKLPRDTKHKFKIYEGNTIRTDSPDSYDMAIENFLWKARLKDLTKSSTGVDAKLVAYLDQRYLEGKEVGTGSQLVFASQSWVPNLDHKKMQQLPASKRTLTEWSRLAAAATRQPVPWLVCMVVGNTVLVRSGAAHASAWRVMVDCYLKQVILPTGRTHMENVTLHLNPQELHEVMALVNNVVNGMSQKNLAKHDQVGSRLLAVLGDRCAATSWHKEKDGVAMGSSSSCSPELEVSGKN